MYQDVSAVAAIVVIIALAVLILWIKDRNNIAGTVVKRTLGAVALPFGTMTIIWLVYNLFHPTENVQWIQTMVRLAFAIVLVAVGRRWLTDTGPGIEDTPADFTCDELTASVERARETLPWFLEQVDQNVDNAFIKFALTTPNEQIEHIWAYVHNYRDGLFNVSLANDPYDTDQESSGRRDVPIDAVEDWQIMYPDGKIKGAYSLIALFQHYEANGKKLNRTMRKQKVQLLDA